MPDQPIHDTTTDRDLSAAETPENLPARTQTDGSRAHPPPKSPGPSRYLWPWPNFPGSANRPTPRPDRSDAPQLAPTIKPYRAAHQSPQANTGLPRPKPRNHLAPQDLNHPPAPHLRATDSCLTPPARAQNTDHTGIPPHMCLPRFLGSAETLQPFNQLTHCASCAKTRWPPR
jgi:hypothetical protein